jgi:chemotaxis protein methyltransferase CheR
VIHETPLWPASAGTGTIEPPMLKIRPPECTLLSEYVREISGMEIPASKAYLFETRLGKMANALGCSSYQTLYDLAKADKTLALAQQIIDAMVTSETLFFRDEKAFDLLRYKILPDVIDSPSGYSRKGLPVPIRIWSAACATGQEIYSVAMVLRDLLPCMNAYRIYLLGTDISGKALAKASAGFFSSFEITRGLPPDKRDRYFTPYGTDWKINDEIRSMVSFRKMNLFHSFAGMGRFDIILLRNVAIYFNMEMKKQLFKKIVSVLEPDGYLLLGASESLVEVCSDLEPRRHLKTIFYQPRSRTKHKSVE